MGGAGWNKRPSSFRDLPFQSRTAVRLGEAAACTEHQLYNEGLEVI